MKTIAYLHGFISSPQSRKAVMLGDYLRSQAPDIQYLVPELHHRPAQALSQIQWHCLGRNPQDVLLVGSSLGGFFATVVAEKLGCRAVLLNPAVHPHAHFARYLGPQRNLYTGEEFDLTREHIAELAALDVPALQRPERYWLIVETGDEVLDYREAVAYYHGAFQSVVQGGDHSLSSFSDFVPDIVEWGIGTPGGQAAMKQVLFEEDGVFRVGTILAEAGSSFQVEAAHGKRSKVKASAVLLRFDGEALQAFMPAAQRIADELDPQFLWEVCGPQEFGFGELAKEYFGHPPSPTEAGAVLLRLHSSPIYFYKRGKGRFQGAPEENLKAALAGVEKKRRQQEQVEAWAASLAAGTLPAEIAATRDVLLFKPDKMSLEWRALDRAATLAGLSPPKLLARVGALAGPEDYFLRRFAFGFFPRGTGFAPAQAVSAPAHLAQAAVPAFSIDDHETTEIDDAFSVERLADGRLRIGIHIAAPALFFDRKHDLEAVARERLSTVYFPGGKITMLPETAIAEATLGEGREVPSASLYLDVDPQGFAVTATESRLERVRIATNLRIAELEKRLNETSLAQGRIEGSHGEDLLLLWRLAENLRSARGAGPGKTERLDYTFRVAEDRVAIEPRRRGTPVDVLVSELMIHVNATWGRSLADAGIPAIYRNQQGIKTRMEVDPGKHDWLGVSHYAWSSSPLRRFVDLANQRQLVALLGAASPAYTREDLEAIARDFETAYEAYAEHQRLLERYWCLRWILQEGMAELDATVIRDELVRLEGLPLVCRTTGMPALPPGERIRVAFGEADLWEVNLPCRYAGKQSGSGSD